MTSSIPFGFSSTASDVLEGVDLTGQNIIVTGGAAGIGLETSRALAAAGAAVTIAARRPNEAERAVTEMRQAMPAARLFVRRLDLSDLFSVREFTESWDEPLHVLVNNAGVMAIPELQRTSEGREMQFATNYLGHFALALGLRKHLASANGARVVSIASTGNLFAPVFWDDPDFRFIPYDPLLAYGQSKTACILMAVGITNNWAGDGITSNACNPGAIATGLQKHTGGLRTPEHLRKTTEQGASTSVLLAGSPLVEGISGRYFDDCQEAPLVDERGAGPFRGVARYAVDPENAFRLWGMATRIVSSPL
ncbi:SDR family NAD(P)-dependent oxidoreductase [Shinella curvata]|uniref:SDR family NAD(P)-dependent oxidoreductase n=1 Tax=Shinella curvata TaxID=1817964 RepID=A0ABT8XKR2_9HYPH|nr:SDR family NAD(P)-dependent oxidoreductase [Shinella curvata]MCJ8056948.1 SDR family NAD(P)-dependent oxidoreductase [Shinella curvata]MDO6124283.1 SDR family NAD(P)-dependent oxidoreductase [Shinella curvata]